MIKFLTVIAFLFLIPLINCSNQGSLKSEYFYSFQPIDFHDGARHIIFADFDGDGNEEYLYQTGTKGLLLNNFDGPYPQTAYHLCGALNVDKFQALNFIGDAAPEIFLPVRKENQAWLEIWGVKHSFGAIECEFIQKTRPIEGLDNDGDGTWDGRINQFQVLDINGDGQRDILISVETDYDKNPRGIIAYDGKTGDKFWEFPIAGRPGSIFCADLTGDSIKEIVFGTWAPDNGNIIGDMDDSFSYLICLTPDGQLNWKHIMGGIFCATRYVIADINKNGIDEIICTYASGNRADKTTTFELQIRGGKTGEILRYLRLPIEFMQPFIADLNRDGKQEILITNNEKDIFIFNTNLDLLRKSSLGSNIAFCEVCEIVDINQDGTQEIIVSGKKSLYILNDQLEILGKYQATMPIHQAHYFKHPHYGELISLTLWKKENFRNSILLKIHLTSEFQKIINLSPAKNSYVFLLIIFAAGIVTALFALKIIPFLFRKSSSKSIHKLNERRNSLLQTLALFGHGKTATGNLDRLCLLFKNLPKDTFPSPEHQKRINNTITTYFKFTSLQLAEIIKKSKATAIGINRLKNFEKNYKKLENLLSDYKAGTISNNKIEKFSTEISSTVESLEKNIESIKMELAIFYNTDIFATVKEVLAAVSPDLRKENIIFKYFLIKSDVDAIGFIDKFDFSTIFNELIRNAINSMFSTLTKEIKVKIDIQDEKILIEVTDSGYGIKKENINKIFDRDYSTKKDGGFGLFHAKNTLGKYNGKIKVIQSAPGKGTTMRVEVKKV